MIEKNIIIVSNRLDKINKINNIEIYFKNLATGSTIFPRANTPINTYGDEFILYEYTPVFDNSYIFITPNLSYTSSTNFNHVSSAIFLNDNTTAEGAMISYCTFSNTPSHIIYRTKSINTSKNPIIIRVRIGGNNAATTITFNPFLASNTTSSLLIEEYFFS